MICPYCEQNVIVDFELITDACSGDEGASVFVCTNCGGVTVMEEQTLRLPTESEIYEIKSTPELWQPISEYLAGRDLKGFAHYTRDASGHGNQTGGNDSTGEGTHSGS